MDTFTTISCETEGPVARVTLNRPEARNALNEQVIAELSAWAEAIRTKPDVRVVVLAALLMQNVAGK